MDDDLNAVPAAWGGADEIIDHHSDLSPFAIERILPEDRRRFLQLREPFMVLCGNYPVRAAILECARFEMERRFRYTADRKKPDLEWQEEQHRILLGPNPEKADLWAPFPADRIVSRLCGISTNKNSIGRAIAWLTKAGYIFTGKTARPRNGRKVLLNVKQIERDLRDSEFYEGVDFTPAVKGHPDQFMVEPTDQLFTPLYEGLSQLVVDASGEPSPNMETARAAMLLHRILVRAEAREKAGETIPAVWSFSHIHQSFGFGDHRSWKAALLRLTSSNLVTIVGKEYSAPVVAPNLSRILYLTRGITEVKASPDVEHTFNRDGSHIDPMRTTQVPDGVIQPAKRGTHIEPNVPTLRTESFSESLTEYLAELKAVGDFDPSKVLEDHSDHIFEVRRKTQFVGLPFENGWETLTFSRLAQTDEELAAAALLLAQQLGRGERSAIAFPRATRKARAIIAVILGYWIDDHVTGTTPAEWITIDGTWFDMYNADFKKPEEQPLANARREMDRRLEATNNALIIENIAGSRQHAQIITKLKSAITGRADNLMPVIYVGLPDSVSDLSPKLDDGGLTPIVVRSLTERHKRFEVPDPPVPVEITDEALGDDPFGEP